MHFPSGLIKKRKAFELEALDTKWVVKADSFTGRPVVNCNLLFFSLRKKIDSGCSCFYTSSTLHIYRQSFIYLSPSEWYHGVRANWTFILWEYKYHIKESDPGLLRICTLPTDKGISSPLMDQSSWIRDLKNELQYETRQPGFFPLKPPAEFWHDEENQSQTLLCFSYLLFFFRPLLLSLFIKPSISYGVRHVCYLFFEVGLWCDNIFHNRELWAHWLSFESPVMVKRG